MTKFINPESVWQPFGPFSLVAVADEGVPVYLKGQIPLDHDGALVGAGDMDTQVRQVLINIRDALSRVGGQISDIVELRQFTTDIEAFMAAGHVRQEFFSEPYPITTTVEVSRLFRPDIMIEIALTAHVPEARLKRGA